MATYPLPGGRLSPGRGFEGPLPKHTGADLIHSGGTCGRQVVAPISGRARWSENLGGGHGLLITNGPEEWGLWHLSGRLVRTGTMVTEGQAVAKAGASGTRVQGCNLHVERKINGQLTDPMPALSAPSADAHDLGHITTYPAGGCPVGYVPARIGAPLVDLPLIGATPLGSNIIEAIGKRGDAGNWNACLLASRGYQVGDDPYAPGTVPGAIANELTEGLADAVPIIVNAGVVVAALLVGWTGVKQALGIR